MVSDFAVTVLLSQFAARERSKSPQARACVLRILRLAPPARPAKKHEAAGGHLVYQIRIANGERAIPRP